MIFESVYVSKMCEIAVLGKVRKEEGGGERGDGGGGQQDGEGCRGGLWGEIEIEMVVVN